MSPTIADDHAARIHGLFSALTSQGPGYAVGVVRDGAPVFTGGWGAADLEHGVAITPASRFYLGSVSKQFVAMSALMLAAEQGIDLAQPIGDTFPELTPPTADATLYQLLTHTSGIRDFYALGGLAGYDGETVYTEHLALRLLARQAGLNFPPARTGSTATRAICCWRCSSTGCRASGSTTSPASGSSRR